MNGPVDPRNGTVVKTILVAIFFFYIAYLIGDWLKEILNSYFQSFFIGAGAMFIIGFFLTIAEIFTNETH